MIRMWLEYGSPYICPLYPTSFSFAKHLLFKDYFSCFIITNWLLSTFLLWHIYWQSMAYIHIIRWHCLFTLSYKNTFAFQQRGSIILKIKCFSNSIDRFQICHCLRRCSIRTTITIRKNISNKWCLWFT